VHELFPFVMKELTKIIEIDRNNIEAKSPAFTKLLIEYLDAMPTDIKRNLVHDYLFKEEDRDVVAVLYEIIQALHLFDFDLIDKLLFSSNFEVKKRAVVIASFDKPYYLAEDLNKLHLLAEKITTEFPERGKRIVKKQLLSSKEKEMWQCECGRTSDINAYCECGKDINGFRHAEMKPETVEKNLKEKISLLSTFYH
jgi:hypothetical protein